MRLATKCMGNVGLGITFVQRAREINQLAVQFGCILVVAQPHNPKLRNNLDDFAFSSPSVLWLNRTNYFGFWASMQRKPRFMQVNKAHKHRLSALVNVQMALGQTAGCPRVNRAKKFMCSPRDTGNINFFLWLTGQLSQGCPGFQKVYVFKVYVPSSCPNESRFPATGRGNPWECAGQSGGVWLPEPKYSASDNGGS